jgi:head-tail adaptor
VRAGRLDKIITLELKILTENAHGQWVTTWGPPFNLAADVPTINDTTARFTIRYREDVRKDTHRITYWDRIWTINNAEHNRKTDETIIDSDFSSLIEATHLQSTEREYIDGLQIQRPRE